ncbi:MAG: hypothetical protein AABZ84_04245 [Pseudomonadota bacterium]
MTRSLLIALLGVVLTACNGSQDTTSGDSNVPSGTGSNGNPTTSDPTGSNPTAFDPTAMILDAPPSDGKLPAELTPPV